MSGMRFGSKSDTKIIWSGPTKSFTLKSYVQIYPQFPINDNFARSDHIIFNVINIKFL